jgi:hypothetical protein
MVSQLRIYVCGGLLTGKNFGRARKSGEKEVVTRIKKGCLELTG